jgi:hypothetical protein
MVEAGEVPPESVVQVAYDGGSEQLTLTVEAE